MSKSEFILLYPVARRLIASMGIRGLSLRSVAQEAGTSVGSINYHIGDKNALIARLIEEETEQRSVIHNVWKKRAGRLDMAQAPILAQVITGYLDAVAASRDGAMTLCELSLEAGLNPSSYPAMQEILRTETQFWIDMLIPLYREMADILGRVISGYCHDELPFSVALAGNADYRLLRSATIQRISEGFAGSATGLAAHFDDLVSACGAQDMGGLSPLVVDLPEGSKKAELATYIARVINRLGASGVTHRAVAAEAGISNSSVAHHFRTHEDLLHAGMGALILQMRQHIGVKTPEGLDAQRRMTAIRATHSIAMASCRHPHLLPFALDMRRRRAENVRDRLGKAIAGEDLLDRAAIQAAAIAIIGFSLAGQSWVGEGDAPSLTPDMLADLRGFFSARGKPQGQDLLIA